MGDHAVGDGHILLGPDLLHPSGHGGGDGGGGLVIGGIRYLVIQVLQRGLEGGHGREHRGHIHRRQGLALGDGVAGFHQHLRQGDTVGDGDGLQIVFRQDALAGDLHAQGARDHLGGADVDAAGAEALPDMGPQIAHRDHQGHGHQDHHGQHRDQYPPAAAFLLLLQLPEESLVLVHFLTHEMCSFFQ